MVSEIPGIPAVIPGVLRANVVPWVFGIWVTVVPWIPEVFGVSELPAAHGIPSIPGILGVPTKKGIQNFIFYVAK